MDVDVHEEECEAVKRDDESRIHLFVVCEQVKGEEGARRLGV